LRVIGLACLFGHNSCIKRFSEAKVVDATVSVKDGEIAKNDSQKEASTSIALAIYRLKLSRSSHLK
jgi:hypothetical protein